MHNPSPNPANRLATIAIVVGAIVLAGGRALVPSASPTKLRVELPVDGNLDEALLNAVVHHTPTDSRSHITATRWTGRALEVDVEIEGPRVVVMVDNHGHTSVDRLAGSGTAILRMQHGLAPAPPFTVVILAARGAAFELQDKANVDSMPPYDSGSAER